MSLQIAIVKQATLFGEAFETGAVTQARSTKKGQPWGATMGVGQLIFCKRVLNSPLCGSEVFDSTFTFESGRKPQLRHAGQRSVIAYRADWERRGYLLSFRIDPFNDLRA